MKKVFSVLAIASAFAFVACGPSAEEMKKKEEQRVQDSIAAADSAAAAMQEMNAEAAPEVDTTAIDTAAAAPAEEGTTK